MYGDSLMNPIHVRNEIQDSDELILQAKMRSETVDQKVDEARKLLYSETGNYLPEVNLSLEQALVIDRLLCDYRLQMYTCALKAPFYQRVLKHLVEDRRWIIATRVLNIFKK